MIRFRTPLPPESAMRLHGDLDRLRDCLPTAFVQHGSGSLITMGDAQTWGPWREPAGGIAYQLADPMPDFQQAWVRDIPGAYPVKLTCGITIPVRPFALDGFALNLLTGESGEPTTEYGRAVLHLSERILSGENIPASDEDVRIVLCDILVRAVRLPIEAIAVYPLVSTTDVPLILEAAAGLPKATFAAIGLCADSAASTPQA